jgi:hypothetical protein
MIYPAAYDITILQNSTWKAALRATEQRRTIDSIVISGGKPLFNSECHKLINGDKVVFTGIAPSGGSLQAPCGIELNTVYFVISSGLTSDAFYVATSSGGTAVSADSVGSGTFYAAKPVNLSGYTIDADLRSLEADQQVATFSGALVTAADGLFQLSMAPSTTSGIETGRYGYDVSLTSGGERYYWLQGIATVARTYSRN